MQENVFIPQHLMTYGDVALLKTLREYERTYVQLSSRTTPAFTRIRDQIVEAIELIEDELRRRGRMGVTGIPARHMGTC